MANGVSVSLPLVYGRQDGPFQLNKTIEEAVKQNFKNLVLTIKGERIMDPNFGVGIHSYLFQNYTLATTQDLREETISQVKKYMPFINILDFKVTEANTNPNQFYIYIKYSINSLNALDELTFVVSR